MRAGFTTKTRRTQRRDSRIQDQQSPIHVTAIPSSSLCPSCLCGEPLRSVIMFDLPAVQAAIRAQGFDGWLLYDFRGINVLARRVVGLDREEALAALVLLRPRDRRAAEARPPHRAGRPSTHLPGDRRPSTSAGRSWRPASASCVAGAKRVAMEYSPRNGNPYVSRVDAGTRRAGPVVRRRGRVVRRPGAAVRGHLGRRAVGQPLRRREGHRLGLRRRLGVHRRAGQGRRADDRAGRAEADHGPLRGNTAARRTPADRRRRPAQRRPALRADARDERARSGRATSC